MKPTKVECAQAAINQLPAWATMSGDIRLTPFYDMPEVMKKVRRNGGRGSNSVPSLLLTTALRSNRLNKRTNERTNTGGGVCGGDQQGHQRAADTRPCEQV